MCASIEVIKIIAYVFTALISVGVSLHTFNKNEKRKREFFKKTEENKRSFHFLEQTWNNKFSMFELIISKLYQSIDDTSTCLFIKDVSLEEDIVKGTKGLIAWVIKTEYATGEEPISKEESSKLMSLKESELGSNIKFLKSIKNELMNFYQNKANNHREKIFEITGKLNLIVLDINIPGNVNSIIEEIPQYTLDYLQGREDDYDEFLENIRGKIIVIINKMRQELIETLQLNLEDLSEKMILKKT